MANDRNQRSYNTVKVGAQEPGTTKRTTEPFVMLPAEVLNSTAYKGLGYSSRAILIELIHFYYGGNNGRLWIAPEMLKERGFSKNTAIRSYKELIVHGFIFQTRKGGSTKGGCSWFALTWLPINKSAGMDLNCYEHKRFLKFIPQEKKSCPKLGTAKTQNGYHAKGDALDGNAKQSKGASFQALDSDPVIPKLVPYKDIAIYRGQINQAHLEKTTRPNWIAQDQSRIQKIGLAGRECYQSPTKLH